MILHPFEKISGIDTANPYKGHVNLTKGEKFIDVARDFHNHSVFVKSDEFPTSIIANEAIHVYYDVSGSVIGAEVFARWLKAAGFEFSFEGLNLFPDTMQVLADEIRSRHMSFSLGSYGIDIAELGLSYFCSDFEGDLDCRIDCVYVNFDRNQ